MGFYAKYVLPRLIDLAMRNKETARLRADWIPLARGDVLEVGIGSGLNLPFYSSQVLRVYGLDPSPELQRMARARMAATRLEVEFLVQPAEAPVPLADRSIDTVVLTGTVFDSECPHRASADQARPQGRRAPPLPRTWPRTRS